MYVCLGLRRLACLLMLLSAMTAFAADEGSVRGTITDPLGAAVVSATVELLDGASVAASTTTDGAGDYQFPLHKSARYRVRAVAATFEATTSDAIFVTATGKPQMNVTLATKTLTDEIIVTATGTPTPEAQVGSAVSVQTAGDYRYATEVQDPLRLIPGVQLSQTGQTAVPPG